MSQRTITSFYNTRKRLQSNLKLKELPSKSSFVDEILIKSTQVVDLHADKHVKQTTTKSSGVLRSAKEENVSKKITEKFEKDSLSRSPKRTLPLPKDSTPTKKKSLPSRYKESTLEEKTEQLPMSTKVIKPTRRKLQLTSDSRVNKDECPKGNLQSAIQKPLLKIDPSDPKIEKLKTDLAKFLEKTSKIKEYQLCSTKITSVISPSKSVEDLSHALSIKPSHEKFQSLVRQQSSTLIMPEKYKFISEAFHCLDRVVCIINNRKEVVTFEKVQEGVQKMLKRNFTKNHLSQIVTVLPTAYTFVVEKSNFIRKKVDAPDYLFVIAPNISIEGNTKSKFISLSPQCLLQRRHEFDSNLMNIVKKHHQEFLRSIHFPPVSDEAIKNWHPKFLIDQVPDIELAKLPEIPETKVYSAKDVLNKVKGTFCGKVEKALQSVAEEPSSSGIVLKLKSMRSPPKNAASAKNALSGICTDLLEKIRAKESAKLLESMTRTPDETKRLAMMERLPKIVNILWHYFIAEKKAAIPIDTAVDKIIHSFNSLTTPDAVKEHLDLIIKTFPGWLTFVEIRKGVYITMDKKQNITEMLEKFNAK